jgi:hypothetical protein
MRLRSMGLFLLALLVSLGALHAWRRPRPGDSGDREGGIALAPPPEPAPVPAPASEPPPAAHEVQAALDRVFQEAVAVDDATRPSFLTGDFNGDGVVDLAAAVRPRRAALSTLNAGQGGWTLQDAVAPPSGSVNGHPRVTVAGTDLLLAMVHGAGAGAWRSGDARQGFLLKNAARAGMRSRPLAEMPPAVRMSVVRAHTGDVLVADRGGRSGLLVFSGAAYAWSDL